MIIKEAFSRSLLCCLLRIFKVFNGYLNLYKVESTAISVALSGVKGAMKEIYFSFDLKVFSEEVGF